MTPVNDELQLVNCFRTENTFFFITLVMRVGRGQDDDTFRKYSKQ